MQTRSQNTLFRRFCCVCLPLLVGLLAPAAVFAQDQGDVMQIFRQTEKQVQQLNKLQPLTQNQMLATRRAVEDFSKATSAEGVERATKQCLTDFRKTERALENLSRLLKDLSDSFGGLGSIKESVEGERQFEALSNSIDNLNQAFSPLVKTDGIQAEAQLAKVSSQQMNLLQNKMEELRQQAAAHQEKADQSPSNLERTGELLARLSVVVDLVKLQNGTYRQVVLTSATYKAPTIEKREALENLMGEFGTPSIMVEQIKGLAASMSEVGAALIRTIISTAPDGLTGVTDVEVKAAIAAMNKVQEDTCEECTDGIDNDLDGKIDAFQSGNCRLFVDWDPDCIAANASL